MTLLNASELAPGTVVRTTVGVLGGGPAGLSVGLRLAERGVDCVVVESGAEVFDGRTQDLYQGEANGYWDLTATRVRQLGGTTNHFAGQLRPLDPVDFEDVSWRAGTSWPFPYAEYAAQFPRTEELLGLVPGRWNAGAELNDLPDLAVGGAIEFEPIVFQYKAGSFAERHRAALATSGPLTVLLGANATAVRTNPAGDAVVGVDLATLAGSELRLEADRYVVALGGIESPRLLLASRGTQPAGVGNSSGLVGRYFSDHPEVRGLPLLAMPGGRAWDLVELGDMGPDGAVGVATQLSVTADTQRRAGLPGIHVRTEIYPIPFPDGPTPEGVAALLSPLEPPPAVIISLAVGFDATPNPDSAVTLLDETNELGDPLAAVDWRLHPDDEQRIDDVLHALARVAAMSGAGRLGIDPPGGRWADVVTGGHHHMGTLRMASDPTAGVVDANARFHDVSNLYAAGSSVFPTYGHANPTFTVVALSLRLADHLAAQVAP